MRVQFWPSPPRLGLQVFPRFLSVFPLRCHHQLVCTYPIPTMRIFSREPSSPFLPRRSTLSARFPDSHLLPRQPSDGANLVPPEPAALLGRWLHLCFPVFSSFSRSLSLRPDFFNQRYFHRLPHLPMNWSLLALRCSLDPSLF